MILRELTSDDYDAVCALWHRSGITSFKPQGRDSRQAFADQLQSGRQAVIGLEIDGELIGVVVATHDGRKGWINRLAVDPAHRRQGCGGQLVAAAEQTLHSQGIQVIAALIEESNLASWALFQRQGYLLSPDVLYLSKRSSPQV